MNLLTQEKAWRFITSVVRRDTGRIVRDEQIAVLATLLRRASAVRCPCSPAALVDAVAETLRGLRVDQDIRSRVDETLEGLIACGDLLLAKVHAGDEETVHLAPPSYVRRKSGALFMFGGFPDIGMPLSQDLLARLTSRGCTRQLAADGTIPVVEILDEQGFIDYPLHAWIEAPMIRPPAEIVNSMNRLLDAQGRSGEVEGLLVLDGTRPQDYYRGRWAAPQRRSGRFVARRPRKWGAPIWCYVELEEGEPLRLIDLPQLDRRFRGCDEAWWLQNALDAEAGRPQVVQVRRSSGRLTRVSVQTPLPMWAERRLLLVGEPAGDRPGGELLAYQIDPGETDEELAFLAETLWFRVREIA